VMAIIIFGFWSGEFRALVSREHSLTHNPSNTHGFRSSIMIQEIW
jgi:hypothetical protein